MIVDAFEQVARGIDQVEAQAEQHKNEAADALKSRAAMEERVRELEHAESQRSRGAKAKAAARIKELERALKDSEATRKALED